MKAILGITLILVCLVVAAAQRPSEMFGWVKDKNNSPVKGVVVSIGNFSVATDANGYYKMTFLKPGVKVVSLTPPGKVTRSYKVTIGPNPKRQDFVIDW